MRADILGAQWRLGVSESCAHFLELMKATPADSVTQVLNVLKDLTDRQPPTELPENALRFSEALQGRDRSLHGASTETNREAERTA